MIPPKTDTKLISKEELRSVNFKAASGNPSHDELRDRRRKLQLSVLLADQAEAMVKIVFNTIDGYHEVKTAIWGATEKYILLTGGSFIPMESVACVSLD